MPVSPNRAVRPSDRVFHAIVAAGLAAMFAVTLIPCDRSTWWPTFSAHGPSESMCLLRRASGIPCPTCGMTRSFRCLGQGLWADGFAFHPLAPVLFVVFAVVMVRSAGVAARGQTWLDGTARVLVWSIPVLAAAVLVLWAARLAVFFSSGAGAAAWHASPLGRLVAAVF